MHYCTRRAFKFIMDLAIIFLTFLVLDTTCAKNKDLKRLHKQVYVNDEDILRCWNQSTNRDTLSFYKDSSCIVRLDAKKSCSTVRNCPKVCFSKRKRIGDDGMKKTITKVHEIGESWTTKRHSCKCFLAKDVMPGSMPNLLMDNFGVYIPTPHQLPRSVCHPKGCVHPTKNKHVKEGATMRSPRGICTCVKGSDPDKSNVDTWYHWSCANNDVH
ncbi:unnamed protein product [Owenia fusiformis]|uniref:Uncharacterized protein n=1 Tax=Owenia fusiformis TaxID=6347 RepID=A0A8J1URD0_OWEFU|nr:unnamed protein product [Owenia fusiformis]